MGCVRILAVLLFAALTTGSSFAETSPELQRAAQDAYTRGARSYEVGEFAAALEDFKTAYRLVPYPDFLFNLAQCERKLGMRDEALHEYKQYLSKKPDAPNRTDVEQLIAELQVAIEQARLTTQPPEEKKKKPLYKKWWLWTTVGVVVAGAAVGIAVPLALRNHDGSSPGTYPDIGPGVHSSALAVVH